MSTTETLPLLTNSRMSCAKTCLRKHFYRYEIGLVRDAEKAPLKFGSAFHHGRELIRYGTPVDDAINTATADYLNATDERLQYDHYTIRALLAGWAWHWQEPNGQAIATELSWQMPLVNPETGKPSRTWTLAGKLDGIDQIDGRLLVSECKTAGEEIGPDAAYWLRLRADQQIALYVIAARAAGHAVSGVLYDVVRKPTIRPCQVPTLDENGLKIVLNADGSRAVNKNGTPRQTNGEGLTLVARQETPEEFGERLLADIQSRPEFYFQRREIPVLDSDIDELRYELWQQGQHIRECQIAGRWFRTVGRMTCDHCEYAALCLNHVQVDPASPPAGYSISDDVNPELISE